jgi:hypothetical protein
MLRRVSLVLHCVTLAVLQTGAAAHSLQPLFEEEVIPTEIGVGDQGTGDGPHYHIAPWSRNPDATGTGGT